MKTWMFGVMAGVLAVGGVAVWMVTSGQEADSMQEAATPLPAGPAPELPGFDHPVGMAPATQPVPLTPISGSPDQPSPGDVAAAADAAQPDGEDVTLTGRVVDGNRRPVEGASVLYVADPMRLQMQARDDREPLTKLPATKTDRNGRFELAARVPFEDDTRDRFPFGIESQQLVVRDDSFATLVQSLGSVIGPSYDVGELVLEPGAWISGRAVDSDGRPVAGAQARASNDVDRRGGPGGGGVLSFFGRNLAESLEAATTSSDGRFVVRGLHPGKASLTVGKSGLRAAAREELELKEQVGLDLGDVTLEKGVSIAGVVLDEQGAPLVGADVSVSSMSRLVLNRIEDLPRQQLRQELGQRARTDESGHFELGGLAGGTYTVHANAEGYDSLSKADVPAGTHDLRLEPRKLGGLLVRLTSADGGAPVSGAEISASPKQTDRFSFGPRVRSEAEVLAGAEALAAAGKTGDPAGAYFVPHAGLEGTELVVSAEGFATTSLDAPGAPSGGVEEYPAQIAPESVVAGMVSDSDGHPVLHARLTLRSTGEDDGTFDIRGGPDRREARRSIRIGDDQGPSATRHSAVSGVDGRFEFHGVAAGDWELSARAKGYVRGDPQSLTLEAGNSQRDLRVVLEPAGSIAGVVTDPDGSVVPGIAVSLEPLSAATAPSEAADASGRQTLRLGDLAGGGGSGRRRARTDVHGGYLISDLAPGEYTVRLDEGPRGGMFGGAGFVLALDGDQPQQAPGTYAKVEAGRETRVDFQRPERARLTGRVLAGGMPAPGIQVHLRPPGGMPFMGGGRTESTDSHGNYAFDDVTAGDYEVSAIVPGAAIEEKLPLELEAGQVRSADLVFGGSTVSGRVLEQGTDKPAAGVNIAVVPVVETENSAPRLEFAMVMVDSGGGSSGSTISIGGGPANLVRTDGQGRFEVRYLKPGQYRIEASGEGYVRIAPEQVEVKDGENRDDVVLRVQRGAVLTGVVLDSATGQRLDKVPVRLESESNTAMAVTNDGVYRFEGLEPGDYTVSVMGSGFMSEPLATEKITLESGQQATLDLKTKPSEG